MNSSPLLLTTVQIAVTHYNTGALLNQALSLLDKTVNYIVAMNMGVMCANINTIHLLNIYNTH